MIRRLPALPNTLTRRSFLRLAAAASGGLAVAPTLGCCGKGSDPDIRDVVVIGGGFAGLMAALELSSYDVLLLELEPVAGGRICAGTRGDLSGRNQSSRSASIASKRRNRPERTWDRWRASLPSTSTLSSLRARFGITWMAYEFTCWSQNQAPVPTWMYLGSRSRSSRMASRKARPCSPSRRHSAM